MDIKCQQQVSPFRYQCLRSERTAPVPHSYDLLHCSVPVKSFFQTLAALRCALPFEYIRDGVKDKLSRVNNWALHRKV